MLLVHLGILLRVRILVPPDNLLNRRWLRAKTLALRGQHDKSRTHRHRDEGGHYRHGDHASLHALIMLALLANMLRSDVPGERLITQVRRRRGAAGHSPSNHTPRGELIDGPHRTARKLGLFGLPRFRAVGSHIFFRRGCVIFLRPKWDRL